MRIGDMKKIDVGNGSLATLDEGTGDVLLLVHGFPLNHTMWREQITTLKEHYRVIAPDLRGFGQSNDSAASSPTTASTAPTLTMEQHADDLASLLDRLGIDGGVHFCGLSMGGYIAWQFWKKYAARVRSLILCDTRASADSEEAATGRLAMAERVLTDGTAFVADAMLPNLVAPRQLSGDSDVADRLRNMIESTSPESIAAAQRGMAARIDATHLLRDIDVPSLVLVGEHDAITTATEMQSIAEAIPGSRFATIPDAGHMAPMEEPAAVTMAIKDFLAMA